MWDSVNEMLRNNIHWNDKIIEINSFIEHCKKHENADGYIKSTFFKSIIIKRAKFLSGPFVNMFFNIIEKQKRKMKVIIGNIVTTIPDNKKTTDGPGGKS